MKSMTSPPRAEPEDEVDALIATLHETERRLEELTGGEVDTVTTGSGQPYLLRRAQDQLRDTGADKQAAILNALPAHIALLDPQGIVVSVNLAWQQFASANFLQGPEFALGLNYLDICDRTEGVDAPYARRAAEGIRSVLAEVKSFSLEYPCPSPTEQRWFLMTVTPLTGDSLHGAVVMHLNITERIQVAMELRRSRDEFQELAESMPQIVWITRPDGWNIFFNQQWMDYTGLSREESLGHGWNKPFHPDDQQRAMQAWQHATATSGEYSLECRLRRADGIYRWWLIRGVPIFNDTGKIFKWFGTCTDIHNLKVAELKIKEANEALRLSKERLRAAISASGAGTFCWDIRTNGLDWDHSLDALFGLPLGKTARSLDAFLGTVHPADRAEVIARCERCARDGVDFAMEFRVVWPDGSLHWLDDRGKTFFDDASQPTYMTGACVDITERKQAENALHQQQIELRALFDLIPAMIWFKDTENRILRVNQRVAEAAGKTVAEIEGKPSQDIYPQDAARFFADDLAVLRTGAPKLGYVEAVTNPAGKKLWVQTDKVPVRDREGKTTGIIVMAQDITERREAMEALRESNEKFHQLADNISDVFWIRSPDMKRVDYVSPAFEKIWGRTVASLLANPQEWSEFILLEDRERVRAAFAGLTNGTSNLEIEYRIVRPSGEIRWVRVRGFQVWNATDQLIRHIGIVTDITESKQLSEHLQQAQKMEALGQFSGGVAHDFNNILATIGGYTELARIQLQENPAVREHLGSVIKATNRAADLVRQILTFSRQQPQAREVLLLQPVVVESMKLMRAIIPSTVEIDAVIASEAPTVLANANQVHQMLMNLAINGWHALKNHPGVLQVKLEKVEVDAAPAAAKPGLRPGTYACLSVSDTGCGMDQATVRRIFEPFFTTKPPGEGTGLGLAVVHGIMDSHDGAVTVNSQLGVGTTFRLYFPEHLGESTPDGGSTGPTPRGRGESVLVVDDEEMLAKLGANFLTRLGYSAVSTTSSAQALAMVRDEPARFALVLTDQTMPGMTGLQLASQLRDIRPGLPVMLMTGYGFSLTADRVASSCIRNILQKPFTMHSLGTAVHATLAGTTHPNGTNPPY